MCDNTSYTLNKYVWVKIICIYKGSLLSFALENIICLSLFQSPSLIHISGNHETILNNNGTMCQKVQNFDVMNDYDV